MSLKQNFGQFYASMSIEELINIKDLKKKINDKKFISTVDKHRGNQAIIGFSCQVCFWRRNPANNFKRGIFQVHINAFK